MAYPLITPFMPYILSPEDRSRLDCIRSCISQEITNTEASKRLSITVRQVQRLKRRVEEGGEQGIIHLGRGKTSNRKTKQETLDTVLAFLQKPAHADFGPTFAKEKLENNGVVLGTETLRTFMLHEKLWKERKRKGPMLHRAWRERMGSFGELVQFDGSYHDWFENTGEACLLAAIDDATSRVVRAVFDANEGVFAVFRFWKAYIETYGLPVAIYLDKFSTYKINHKSAVDNPDLITQFERAMSTLGVRVICANSPEAKGRVERLFGTLQDRLVKEMRLAGIGTEEDANTYLQDTYLPEHNERFEVVARNKGDAHRSLTKEMRKMLPSIFSVHSERLVHGDFTVQFKGAWLQLNAVQDIAVYKKDTVLIEERLDGTLHIRLKETYLKYTILPERPKKANIPVTALTREKPRWKPPANHPWRNEREKLISQKRLK